MLGTSSQFPTKQRNHSSVYLRFKKFKALFDCGEGTQRQMRILTLSPHSINALFISHWHGDHTLGIGGIIQSMSASERRKTLTIYGPKTTKDRVNKIINTYYFRKTFNVKVVELNPESYQTFMDEEEFKVSCFPLKHGIPTIGYVFENKPVRKINLDYTKKFGLTQHPLLGKLQEGKDITYNGKKIKADKATYFKPGKRISYVSDTGYFEKLIDYVKKSNLLICEATLSEDDKGKSRDYNHMSNLDAAKIARKSGAEQLIITHISQRYTNIKPMLAEARKQFKKTKYAKDFDHYKIS